LLHPNLPYQEAEVIYHARKEMARTVEDVLARRTRALLLDARASAESAPRVASLLARELKRDRAWVTDEVQRYRELARGYTFQDPASSEDTTS
jgi:glycerol-3-phosphate dehydrogenase